MSHDKSRVSGNATNISWYFTLNMLYHRNHDGVPLSTYIISFVATPNMLYHWNHHGISLSTYIISFVVHHTYFWTMESPPDWSTHTRSPRWSRQYPRNHLATNQVTGSNLGESGNTLQSVVSPQNTLQSEVHVSKVDGKNTHTCVCVA